MGGCIFSHDHSPFGFFPPKNLDGASSCSFAGRGAVFCWIGPVPVEPMSFPAVSFPAMSGAAMSGAAISLLAVVPFPPVVMFLLESPAMTAARTGASRRMRATRKTHTHRKRHPPDGRMPFCLRCHRQGEVGGRGGSGEEKGNGSGRGRRLRDRRYSSSSSSRSRAIR